MNRMIKVGAAVAGLVAVVAVAAGCGETVVHDPMPGDTVSGDKTVVGSGGELTAVYLGRVDGEELYTLCTASGDRLYFWATYREGAMAVHINDASCPK
jgi:hypothetical protein